MRGRTIRLFLVDGVPTGILTAEIMNWTGKAIVVPRSRLSDLAKRDEAKRTGVYCLIGPDPDQPERDRVYLGEGDNVMQRLAAHDKDPDKDFWTRAVVVISKDDNITKSHGRFLESRLIEMATSASRATIANGTAPPAPPLPEPDVADMEYFLEQVQQMFPLLGMTFLQPQPDYKSGASANQSPRFEMTDVGTNAHAAEIGAEFVVFAGSTARKNGPPSWQSYKPLRDALVAEGKLVDSPNSDYYIFKENVAFSSPSAASSVIAANNTNGRLYWCIEGTDQTYADWHEAKVADAEAKAKSDGAES
jgi:hypothetical protein